MQRTERQAIDHRIACEAGRHVAATRSATTDAAGVRRSHCRHCGCKLTRLPSIGRWFPSGLMGEPPT